MKAPKHAVIILHNVRSKLNVGSIFRTADALGISHIYLTGYTPAPIDRFDRPVQEIIKASLGAEKNISWTKKKYPYSIIKKLKDQQFSVIAIEQAKNSIDYKKVKVKYPIAFILGNEVTGVSDALLKYADVVAEIPMNGDKESLNVSVAAGVALFRILKA